MKIIVGSTLHKCFHEAGHIEVAYLFGARVTRALIDADGNARTSIHHTEDLSTKSPVACGGFSVEHLLFVSSALVDTYGNSLSAAAFTEQAMDNARLDKFPYYIKNPADEFGFYTGSPFQPLPDMTWPTESDGPFIAYALKEIVPKLGSRMLLITALACALYKHRRIEQSDIEALRGDINHSARMPTGAGTVHH